MLNFFFNLKFCIYYLHFILALFQQFFKECGYYWLFMCGKLFISQVIPNLYEFLSSAEHKRRYFEECRNPNSWTPLTSIVFSFHPMKVNGVHQLFGYQHSLKHLLDILLDKGE